MYREYVISTNPYSYWPLDITHGAVDVMGRSGTFASINTPTATGTAPKTYQPLVPGFHASVCNGSTCALGRAFGTAGKEPLPFTIDGWFEIHPNNDYADYGTRNLLSLGTNVVGAQNSNLYVNFPGVLQHHFNIDDYDSRIYFALTWTGNSVSVYIDGENKFVEDAPAGFAFTNSSTTLTINAEFASNVCVYDRALTPQNILDKFNAAVPISHVDACANDNGQVFPMRISNTSYYDIELDQEFGSTDSYNINIDKDGLYSNKVVDALSYDVEPGWNATSVTIGAGEYLYTNALGYLGSDQWVIYIETSDDNSRAGDEYLFSLIGDVQRLECYVDSANDIHIDVTDIAPDGTETPTNITFDDAVNTATGNFVFMYDSGQLFIKTGDPVFTLNPVGGQSKYSINIVVDETTKLVIGADGTYGGAAIPNIGYLATHNSIRTDAELGNNYESYYDSWIATGIWPLNTVNENVGFVESYLIAKVLLPDDEEIKAAYAINYGAHKELSITTSDSTASNLNRFITPISSIPENVTPGVGINQEITVNPYLWAAPAPYGGEANYPSFSKIVVRAITDRKIISENSEAEINLTGTGEAWISAAEPNYFTRNKYDGLFFDSGSVRGVVSDVNVDGVTTHYEYRSFEFLLYIDFDTVNSGRVISIYDGSTERYISINKAGNALSHNFTTVYINNVNMSGKNITNLYNQWVHVYAVLPADLTDRQVYIGGGYNSTNYVNGVGIQNFAAYDYILSADNITEHYSAFLGRYKYSADVADSISVAQNKAPNIYAPAWHTNVIPV
jgi:hypothetical protein